MLQWKCFNLQAANFLGDILAERRAFAGSQQGPVCGKNGLGGYQRNEQQSICTSVYIAVSKRIEEVKRLQYAEWMLCNQVQGSLHRLDFWFFSSKEKNIR
ncbi:hypothetical protein M1D52_04225 [Olivibacter sp. SA151]|uniref:hypothetical protein n=1 Tax=Olivibacter jilunii TaxID=985016 RepID=UPI003F15BA73